MSDLQRAREILEPVKNRLRYYKQQIGEYIFDVRYNERARACFVDVFEADETVICRGVRL